MFLSTPGKPTKTKNKIYLLASTLLGIFLTLLICASLELNYLNWMMKKELTANLNADYALIGICLIIGAVGGFFVGGIWWRKLYVERVWAKKRKKK